MSARRKKEFGITTAVIAYTAALLWRLASSFDGELYPLLIGALIIATMVWMALLSYALALLNSVSTNLALIVIVPLLVLIIGRFHAGAIVGALLLAAFLVIAQQRLTQAIRNHIKYRTFDIFYLGTHVVMIGVITALVGLATAAILNRLSTDQLLISEQLIQRALQPAEPFIQGLVPGYNVRSSVNELIEAQLQEQLGTLPPSSPLIAGQKTAALRNLERQLDRRISGQETISALIADAINRRLDIVITNNRLFVALGIIIIIFFALRTLVPILVWPILALIIFLVYLSRKTGLAYILITTEKVELLRL